MTEKEKLMYDILSRISNMDAPIVFKGALITKLILKEQGYDDVERATKDIDANWVGEPPTMQRLSETIQKALGDLNERFFVEISREYGEGCSAGLSIKDKITGDKIISMDIDVKPIFDERIYYYGQAKIKGVLADEIIADKICSVSSDAVFKHRAKDLIDLYALAHCVEVNVPEVFEICDKVGRKIQVFDAFFNRNDDVKYAYSKLKGIQGKPDYEDVFSYLKKFLAPFVTKDTRPMTWVSKEECWVFNASLDDENMEI